MFKYTICDKELVIKKDGVEVWKGKPNGCLVRSVLAIPNDDDCIVLCEREQTSPKVFANLFRVSPQGNIVWIAKTPESIAVPDRYVHMEMVHGELFANSWTSYRVRIDTRSGRIVEAIFTK
jgi:hypothetical protein